MNKLDRIVEREIKKAEDNYLLDEIMDYAKQKIADSYGFKDFDALIEWEEENTDVEYYTEDVYNYVYDAVLKTLEKTKTIAKNVAQAVAKASFDETNHFVEKLLDGVEDLIERYVDDARWMSWIKKKRKKWEKLKEGFGVGNG